MKIILVFLLLSISLYSCSTGSNVTPQEISERNYRQIQFHETYGKELEEMGMYTASEIQYEQASKIRKKELEKTPDSFLDFVLDILLFNY